MRETKTGFGAKGQYQAEGGLEPDDEESDEANDEASDDDEMLERVAVLVLAATGIPTRETKAALAARPRSSPSNARGGATAARDPSDPARASPGRPRVGPVRGVFGTVAPWDRSFLPRLTRWTTNA